MDKRKSVTGTGFSDLESLFDDIKEKSNPSRNIPKNTPTNSKETTLSKPAHTKQAKSAKDPRRTQKLPSNRAPRAESNKSRLGFENHAGKLFFASLALLVFLLVIGNQEPEPEISKRPSQNRASTPKVQPAPVPSHPVVPNPSNGAIRIDSSYGARLAPFEIKTSGSSNYLVKLVSTVSGQTVMTVFVRGGQTASTDVPLGTYEVRYAAGKTWYGYEHLFGPETSYNKADTTFTFRNDGYQYTGYTITLYTVMDGNMRTSRIGADQF